MYDHSRPFMHSLSMMFGVVVTLFLPLFNIAMSEMLEDFSIVTKFLQLEEGGRKIPDEKSRSRLLIYRICLLLLTISFAFLTDKVEVVLNFSGALLIPIICFYIPIWCNFLLSSYYKTKRSVLIVLHDYLLIIIAMLVQIFGLYYSIWIQILGKEET